jgi:hypothetical protein
VGSSPFRENDSVIVFHMPETTGWGVTFGGRPVVLWDPRPTDLHATDDQFGFTITGDSPIVVVVEARDSLKDSTWTPITTNSLASGPVEFVDVHVTNRPHAFYRLRAP